MDGGRGSDILAGGGYFPPRQQSPAWPRVSLATALAVCEAILERWPHHDVRIKWPNDVFLQGRKVCGILVETVASRPGSAVIGVGVNVNNSLREAPATLRDTATSLIDVLGNSADRADLLIRILQQLAVTLRQLEAESLQLSDRWQQLCLLQGRTVCLESGGRRSVGVCQGIDEEGGAAGAHRDRSRTILDRDDCPRAVIPDYSVPGA